MSVLREELSAPPLTRRPSRSNPTPPASSLAPSAGALPSPSAPSATAGSPSTQAPSCPAPDTPVSPSPHATPATPDAPAHAPGLAAKADDPDYPARAKEEIERLFKDKLSPALAHDDARALGILDALAQGTPYREIAATYRVGVATLTKIAQRQAELETGAVAKLMQSKTLAMLEHWEKAAESGAMSGKHAPAKEWLTHAKVLAPVASEQPIGAKVAIIIGQPGSPVDTSDLQVLDVQALTDDTSTA